jgi:hypothetical protein
MDTGAAPTAGTPSLARSVVLSQTSQTRSGEPPSNPDEIIIAWLEAAETATDGSIL